MRKLVLLLLLLSCLTPGLALASDYPVLDNQVETRRAQLEWLLGVQEFSMEAVVEYISEVSEGNGTTTMSSILADLSGRIDGISSYTTHVGLNNFLRDLKDVSKDFRDESKDMMTTYEGKYLTLIARIASKLEDSQAALDLLKDNYWTVRSGNVLENFDIRVERAQGILDLLEARGYNITEADSKLAEISALRDDLEAALATEDNLEILEVGLETLELSGELVLIVKDLQVTVPPKRVVGHWVNVGNRVVERIGPIISELKTLGLDVSTLETIHGEAVTHAALAEEKHGEGDLIGAVDALIDLQSDIEDLIDAYTGLVFPDGVPAEVETAMSNLAAKLQEIATKLSDALDELQ